MPPSIQKRVKEKGYQLNYKIYTNYINFYFKVRSASTLFRSLFLWYSRRNLRSTLKPFFESDFVTLMCIWPCSSSVILYCVRLWDIVDIAVCLDNLFVINRISIFGCFLRQIHCRSLRFQLVYLTGIWILNAKAYCLDFLKHILSYFILFFRHIYR